MSQIESDVFDTKFATGWIQFSPLRVQDRGELTIGGLRYSIGTRSHQWHVFLNGAADADETPGELVARRLADLINHGSTAIEPHPTWSEGPLLPPHGAVRAEAVGAELRLTARQPGAAGDQIALAWPGEGSAWSNPARDLGRVTLSGPTLAGGRDTGDPSESGPIRVTAFGARGDGDPASAATNLAAFRAAIRAVGDAGGVVHVPPGHYLLSSTLSVPAGVMLEGEGAASVIELRPGVAEKSSLYLTGERAELRDLCLVQGFDSAAIFVHHASDALDDCRILRVTVRSKGRGVYIGHASGARTPLRAVVESCHISIEDAGNTDQHGIIAARGADGALLAGHTIRNNTVLQHSASRGIEMQTGGCLVQGNSVVSPNHKGHPWGIGVFDGSQQRVLGNTVRGFRYSGIEAGNSGDQLIIEANVLVGNECGLSVSGDGRKRDVVIANNTIVLTDDHGGRDEWVAGMRLSGCAAAIVSGTTVRYETILGHSKNASRRFMGIYGDTHLRQLSLSGCAFTNLELGLRVGATSPIVAATACSFDNVQRPMTSNGGGPQHVFDACTFHDCGPMYLNEARVNGRNHPSLSLRGCVFENEADFAAEHGNGACVNKPAVQAYATHNVIVVVDGCTFRGVSSELITYDTSYWDRASSGYGRPALVIERDAGRDRYRTRNYTSWAEIRALYNTLDLPIPREVEFRTWHTELSFRLTEAGVVHVADTAPTQGEWSAGDRVIRKTPVDGQPQGWVCVASGAPGTWRSLGTVGGDASPAELARLSARMDELSALLAPGGVLGSMSLGASRFPAMAGEGAINFGFVAGSLAPDAWFGFTRAGSASATVEYGAALAQLKLAVPAGIRCFVGLLTLSGNVNPGGAASYRSVWTYLVAMSGSYDDALGTQSVELSSKALHGASVPRNGGTELVSLHWGHERTGRAAAPVGTTSFSVVLSQPCFYREIAAPTEPLVAVYDPQVHARLTILHATA